MTRYQLAHRKHFAFGQLVKDEGALVLRLPSCQRRMLELTSTRESLATQSNSRRLRLLRWERHC
jgi:hypothetical protein